jgi:hypothetical protein
MVLHCLRELIQVSGIVFPDDLVFINGKGSVCNFVVDVQFKCLPCEFSDSLPLLPEVNLRKAWFSLLGYLPTSQGASSFTMSHCHPSILYDFDWFVTHPWPWQACQNFYFVSLLCDLWHDQNFSRPGLNPYIQNFKLDVQSHARLF